MRRAQWVLFGGLFVLLPPLAPGEPLLSFGPDIPLFITASASVRHDDNVNLTATNKVSDTVYVLAPGTDFHYNSDVVKTGITFSEQFVRYAAHRDSDLNSNL